MLLDILDNLPRLRMSSNLLRMFLWVLQELGISNMPSYDKFRKMQTELRGLCGTEPKLEKSMLGNIFYVNDVRQSITLVSLVSLVIYLNISKSGTFNL